MATKIIPFAYLDADDQGARLCFLAEFHGWLQMRYERGIINGMDYADTVYLLGNIEGRLLHNGCTERDIELLDSWQDEMDQNSPYEGGYSAVRSANPNAWEPDIDPDAYHVFAPEEIAAWCAFIAGYVQLLQTWMEDHPHNCSYEQDALTQVPRMLIGLRVGHLTEYDYDTLRGWLTDMNESLG